jgi:hypothetical protein
MIFSASALILFAACKKSSSDSNSNPNSPVADSVLILGKWHPVRNVAYYYSPSGAFLDSTAEQISKDDYSNFANGKIYSYFNEPNYGPEYDTVNYYLSGKQLIVYYTRDRNDTSLISKLTQDSLLITATYTNSVDPRNGNPANESDTILMLKVK